MIRSMQVLSTFALLSSCDGRFLLGKKSEAAVRVPTTDHRKFQHTTLENGLTVLAIEDPKASKSGFAVSVSSGSFYDPVELPGLAHFCEHLLFLGTKKYPDETSFDNYLSQHDGSNNAFTEQESTVFYNEVSHAGFDEGMDRFAQFFIAPLFKPEMVGRELNAVNSEHEKNVPDQFRQTWEIMRGTAKNSSVVSHFYTGTKESLHHGDNTTVAALKKYHEENYCAPRMHLVMVSKKTLEEQLDTAKSYFNAVPSGEGKCSPTPRDFSTDHPFSDPSTLGQLLELSTDSKQRLWMMFPMPPTLQSYKAQPASMLEYFLGYAGPGSLKGQLKARNLASDIGIQVDQTAASTLVFAMFDLTPNGVKNPSEVTSVVFEYLRKVRAQDRNQIEQIYSTMQKMSLVTFDYMEAPDSVMDTVSGLASSMRHYAPADVLSGDTAIDVLDVDLVSRLVQGMNPDNVNLALSTHDFNSSRANHYNKYYRLHYSKRPIPNELKNPSAKAIAGLKLSTPPALKYVPSSLSVINATAGEVPQQLSESSCEVWWLGRGLFPLPKAQLRVKLAVPKEMFATAEFTALRRMHVELSNMALEEPLEDLGNCGLTLDLKEISEGYHFSMDGYSEHIADLAAQGMGWFANPSPDQSRFNQAKQKLLDELEDTTSKMPYEHALQALTAITTNGIFGRDEVIAALKATDLGSFNNYLKSLMEHGVRVQLLATGNLDEKTAHGLGDTLVKNLGAKRVLQKDEAASTRVLEASRSVEVRLANPIPKDANSATINAYQYGVPDVAERVRLLMLGKMISNPAYDELRTKEQLGYVVFALLMPHQNTLEMRVIVQGAKENPDVVDTRIEAVMDNFGHGLHNLSSTEFTNWKASVRSAIAQDDQNMAEECDRFWAQISSDESCFGRRQMALEYLDSFNSPEELAKEFTWFRQKGTKKISVRLFGDHSLVTKDPADSLNALQVVHGDSLLEKVAAAKNQKYWPTESICQMHRPAV